MRFFSQTSRQILSCVLCLCVLFMGLPLSMASVSAEEYTFTTTDARALLSHVLTGQELDSKLGDLNDRNTDGALNTTDVRVMLSEILNGENTITLVNNLIRLSSFSDLTDSSGVRTYNVYAPYTDSYTLSCSAASAIEIRSKGTLVASGTTSLTANLQADASYELTVKTRYANRSFELTTVATNHKITLPNEIGTVKNVSNVSLYNNDGYTVESAKLNYQPRAGGTYIYCNNPEMLNSSSVGDALLRNKDLTGEVFCTFEHSNISGSSIYLGYQLKNEGAEDVYVTVTNIGYQTSGSWYGQKAWNDFYNMSFAATGSYNNSDYAFETYTPRVFQPITYRLPAGKAFYVVGGTTSDAYRNINVGSTANKSIKNSACANAVVKFNVTGGAVTGTLYCYNRTSQVSANPAEVGYRCDTNTKTGESYGLQYKGIANHHGVVDNYLQWTFNDQVGSGMLTSDFTNRYASAAALQTITIPYADFWSSDHTHTRQTEWFTNINPQTHNQAVGTDMVEFRCVDVNGVERVIDNDHADGTGHLANTANWMIEYQEHFTLINQGSKPRVVTAHYMDNGALLMMMRDSKTGEVLWTAMPVGGQTNGYNYTCNIDVPAHTARQVTISYVLMPMSAGTVGHMVTLSAP